jgi:succinyl-diaminopimelate desuccinylase
MSGDRTDLAGALTRTVLELVRIPSPSGEESVLADHVFRWLEEHTRPDHLERRGNAVVGRFDGEGPRVILGGHLDTVPENGNPEPAVADGIIHGLGTTDMKGALAVMLHLARDRGRGATLGLVFYDCEEVAYARNGLRTLFAAEPWLEETDLAILMEPTDNLLELGCLGTLHARVTFTGVAAHSARPWAGRNAIHAAAPFLSRLAGHGEREFRDGPACFREVINVTRAEGGHARNVLPDRFHLNVNFRFAPDRSPADAEAFLRSLVPGEAGVEIVDVAPAALPRAGAPLIHTLITDHGLEARAKQAWTDVAQFAARGVPAVNFGPGIPELAHTVAESIPVANLVRSYGILDAFLGGDASR